MSDIFIIISHSAVITSILRTGVMKLNWYWPNKQSGICSIVPKKLVKTLQAQFDDKHS
jgi:hypothetical protein